MVVAAKLVINQNQLIKFLRIAVSGYAYIGNLEAVAFQDDSTLQNSRSPRVVRNIRLPLFHPSRLITDAEQEHSAAGPVPF